VTNRPGFKTDPVFGPYESGNDCYAVLQQTAAARGALGGLMAELIDGHIRHHVNNAAEREQATEELMEIVRSYLR
jgi:DNA-binding FrmR family transcriptional regulator